MFVALVALAAIGVFVWYQRSRELFMLSIRKGQLLHVRGRIPGTLLSAFRDVVVKPPVGRGSIRAVRTPDGARLTTTGVDEWREQRLRNIFHVFPMSQLRSAPVLERRSVGQWLGIAWLAWMLDRSTGS